MSTLQKQFVEWPELVLAPINLWNAPHRPPVLVTVTVPATKH